jgi:CBS domain-containing protein
MEQPNEPRVTTVRPRRHDLPEGHERSPEGGEQPPVAGSGSVSTGPQVPDTRSPEGDDFSSSAAPAGEGSNTPVGEEPTSFQAWDARQPEPSRERFGAPGGAFEESRGMLGMIPGGAGVWGAGLAVVALAGLVYKWWQRRQARHTRMARLRRSLATAGLMAGRTAVNAGLPKAVGRAAGEARSPWLPFALLPLALWLRARGGKSKRAGEELLKPLEVEDRGKRLARETAKVVEQRGRRLIRENEPLSDRGPSRWPWLLALPVLGGAVYAGRRWMSSNGSSDGTWSTDTSRQVRDVMSRDVEVIDPDASVAEAARRMRDLDVGSLPVRDGDRLLGVITDRDVTIRVTAEGQDPNETKVRQAMSAEVAWIFEDETAHAAAAMMRQRQIRRLPVLDRNDRLVGIVALGDLALELGDDELAGDTLEQISKPGR